MKDVSDMVQIGSARSIFVPFTEVALVPRHRHQEI
jgi:hypothetical protein